MSAVIDWCLAHPLLAIAGFWLAFGWVADEIAAGLEQRQ